ncbi:MAG: cupin domain-containing protein [Chloroflexi bacterium]|nr:cupin domain-containing protein [Chloroflexota bacterium]
MYKEPIGQEFAGHVHYQASPSAYEVFMDEQGIPIYRGIGVYDVRQLALAPWQRMGGQGTFIELDGQAGMWGMYIVEVPARGPLNSERHIYEEIFLVIEGRGTTEVWGGGNGKKRIFEWQPGSHFAVPLNTRHRLVNATSSPALVLVATNAPHIMESFQSRSFIFENPFEFSDRYDQSEDYFKPRDELVTDPESGRALLRSSLLPDIAHCYLPLDNNRAPGYRWVTPRMAGNTFFGGNIAEYPSGRYSKAHYHQAGAVLVCLRGMGYTYNWPVELGPRPWEAGKGHLVKVQDYVPGGMVSAAPGGGNWFHQHFSIGKDCLRVRAIMNRELQRNSQKHSNVRTEISEGGRAIGYREEDPQIRKNYKEALQREGVEFQMPESLYRP